MERTSFAKMRCSLARGLELIGDWWTPLIIRDLFLDVGRFDDLVEDLGISRNRWTGPREGRPILFVHTLCGGHFKPTVVCSECGEAIGADSVTAVAGPGGAMKPGTIVIARRLMSPMHLADEMAAT